MMVVPEHDTKLLLVMGLKFGSSAVFGNWECPSAMIIPGSALAWSGDV